MKCALGLAILFGALLSAQASAAETTARNRAGVGKAPALTSTAQPPHPGRSAASRTASDGGDQLSSEQGAKLQESLQKQIATERMMSNSAKKALETNQFVTKPIKN